MGLLSSNPRRWDSDHGPRICFRGARRASDPTHIDVESPVRSWDADTISVEDRNSRYHAPIAAEFGASNEHRINPCGARRRSSSSRISVGAIVNREPGFQSGNVTHQRGRANDMQADEKMDHPSSVACDGYLAFPFTTSESVNDAHSPASSHPTPPQ